MRFILRASSSEEEEGRNMKDVHVSVGIDIPGEISYIPATGIEISYLVAPRIDTD